MLSSMLAVGLGAALGGNARYLLTMWSTARWGSRFPMGTLIANLSGSFLIGVMMVIALSKFEDHSDLFRLFFVTGVLGGYTTFSSFSYETLALIQAGRVQIALVYVLGSVLCSLLGVFIGAAAMRQILG